MLLGMFGAQDQDPVYTLLRAQGMGAQRDRGGIGRGRAQAGRIGGLPAGAALGAVVGHGGQALHLACTQAGLQAFDQARQAFLLAGRAGEQLTIGRHSGHDVLTAQAEFQHRGRQRQAAQALDVLAKRLQGVRDYSVEGVVEDDATKQQLRFRYAMQQPSFSSGELFDATGARARARPQGARERARSPSTRGIDA
jgi:hypothetical protein